MNQDVFILRELANKYAQIASQAEQENVWDLHASLNDLCPKRPIVLIDELPWHELNVMDFSHCNARTRTFAGRRISCGKPFSGTAIFREICW